MVQTGSINRRLTRLEESVGGYGSDGGVCRHAGFTVRYPDGSITGEAICSKCGLQKLVFNIVYDGEEEDAVR